jgi:signal transduction histidine kinase
MVGFVRGALKTTGVARQRLRFAAAGSGMFGLIFIVVLLASFVPQQKDIALLLIELLVIACGAAFYIGFAPPRWLRRVWQLGESGNYLAQLSSKPIDERLNIAELMTDLCRSANRGVGGMAAGIVRKDAVTQQWVLAYTDQLEQIPSLDAEIIARTWDGGASGFLRASDQLSENDRRLLATTGTDTLLVTPLVTSESTWGVLLVFLKYSSLFIEDDLNFVTLLAKQNAILLENGTLVARLQNNSTQLAAANKELESFSYSVSHDLRAPLRALSGFSQILEDDYAAQLEQEAKDYLERIRLASQQMGQLIDDLLRLSQLARAQLSLAEVNLTDLAHRIGAELRERYTEHPPAFQVEDGLLVHGDAHLLQAMLTNLLDNAWKYSSKTPNPQVEFGKTKENGKSAYFVRDNGAGFDMAYANKLFGAFQRLHSANEFEGTGIGLATVQRIVNRHGGKIWVEAAVGKGATFYFTLPDGSLQE